MNFLILMILPHVHSNYCCVLHNDTYKQFGPCCVLLQREGKWWIVRWWLGLDVVDSVQLRRLDSDLPQYQHRVIALFVRLRLGSSTKCGTTTSSRTCHDNKSVKIWSAFRNPIYISRRRQQQQFSRYACMLMRRMPCSSNNNNSNKGWSCIHWVPISSYLRLRPDSSTSYNPISWQFVPVIHSRSSSHPHGGIFFSGTAVAAATASRYEASPSFTAGTYLCSRLELVRLFKTHIYFFLFSLSLTLSLSSLLHTDTSHNIIIITYNSSIILLWMTFLPPKYNITTVCCFVVCYYSWFQARIIN